MTDSKQKKQPIKDDEVMIISSISDLKKMLENTGKLTDTKFEHIFLRALAVFSSIIMGFFIVIYSITIDRTRLADSMDPKKWLSICHLWWVVLKNFQIMSVK